MRLLFYFILFIPFPSTAIVYQYSKVLNEKKGKYEIQIEIEGGSVRVYDLFDKSLKFKDQVPSCNDGNNPRVSLIHYDIGNLKSSSVMHNILFFAYRIDCRNETVEVKYIALHEGIEYSLTGDAFVVNYNHDWSIPVDINFNTKKNENLLKNKKLSDYMSLSWPSKAILIR